MPGIPMTAPATPPLGLYIHIPWCVRKCPYCDFNSHAVRDGIPEDRYLDALIQDLEQDLPRVQGRRVETVFIGGGTPSLLSPEAVHRLLAAVRARLPVRPDAEITLEANPGTVERGRFAEFRAAGVNRLSIGVQSFQDALLARIGRIHSGKDAVRAAEAAHAAGFENFNLDLMYALPGQTPDQALDDARTACRLAPTHISHYQLTIEANTWFHRRPPALPDEDAAWAIQENARAELARHGYEPYEVSALARPGARCRHNLNYWTFGDYLGIGAGAHGKISEPEQGIIRRTVKRRRPEDYMRTAAGPERIAGERVTCADDAAFEFMLNALRLDDGFPETLFSERTGLPLEAVAAPLAEAGARGLIERAGGSIRPTGLGRRFLNDLLALFLPGDDRAPEQGEPGRHAGGMAR